MHPPMRHDLQHGHLLFENLMTQQKSQIDSANLGVCRKIPGKLNNPVIPLEKYSGYLLGAPRENYMSLSLLAGSAFLLCTGRSRSRSS